MEIYTFILLQLITWYGGEDLQEMIQSSNFNSFQVAAARGHLDILEHLITWYGEDDRNEVDKMMIQAGDFYCFKETVNNRHLDVVKLILSCYSGGDHQEMINSTIWYKQEASIALSMPLERSIINLLLIDVYSMILVKKSARLELFFYRHKWTIS